TLFEAGTTENGDYIMLCFTPQNRELHLVNISRETQVSVTFSQWRSRASRNFIFMENRFVHENSTGAWSIYPNGDIVKEQTSYNEWFSQKEQEDKINPAVISSYTRIILKNINTIGINTEKKLVINAHVLCLNNGGHIKMESYGRQQLQCTAQRDGQHEFLFPDGSRVHIHRSGMLILRSSNAAIPDIFIPSILNAALCAATSEYFCGNQFYYKEPLVHLVLKNKGDSPLNTIKHLREVTDISLIEAKKIIDSAPAPVLRFSTELAAQAVKSKLESQGAEAEIHHADKEHRIKQEIISTHRFFSQFVEPFIEHILVNGSRH
ncbi:MAG: ribosomal protein L7/L12, partial [Dinghuibacter sp.]|nr:ribosomal protein L7/L12 [Dinghuibacter sp.]